MCLYWNLQRCITNRCLMYTAPNPRLFAWGTSAWGSTLHPALLLWVCPFAWLPEHSYSRMATRQSWDCFLSHLQGKLHSLRRSLFPLEGVFSGSGIPASSQFNPSLPSMPDHSSVTNYHCWTVIITISLLCLSPLEVFGLSQKFWGRLSWELELLWAIRRWLIQWHVLVLAQCPYFSGELSPCWLSKSNASLSSGVVFGSLPLHFWPRQTCLTYETSLELYNYWSTNVCLFVKKAIIAPICKLISCLNPSIFYLVFCLHFPVLCNIYYPSPLFHHLLSSCYPILFVFFSFKFCLSTCSLSFQLQSKAVRGRSLIFAYLSKK